MPGRLFLTRDLQDLAGQLAVPPEALPHYEPRQNMAPGENLIVQTDEGYGLMRWGLIPSGRVNARGRPVMETIINARSETVFDKSAFEGVKRCVVPVDGWYEWTGEKRKKTAWRIGAKDGGLLRFAAIYDIWTAPGGRRVSQLATVTCAPNDDVAPIHHRMGVLLTRAGAARWLSAEDADARDLCAPWPNGKLHIAPADGVDWSKG